MLTFRQEAQPNKTPRTGERRSYNLDFVTNAAAMTFLYWTRVPDNIKVTTVKKDILTRVHIYLKFINHLLCLSTLLFCYSYSSSLYLHLSSRKFDVSPYLI